MPNAICSVSVDLDAMRCYRSIHGLPDIDGQDAVYAHALPRFLELFAELDICATFFVVGEDAADARNHAVLREAVGRGHELANHSATHPYALPALGAEALRDEVQEGQRAIEEAGGAACVGFRAPGYNIDERTIRLLTELGYAYDSSVFPCPPYYAAKGAAMAVMRLRGRTSGSSMVPARTQIAPLTPYFPRLDAVHRRAKGGHARGLLELPMCVLPGVRFPVIGTSLVLAGPARARWLMKAAAAYHRSFLNIELHGIDLVDADCDGIEPTLRAQQPDLRFDLAHKWDTFQEAFRAVRERYHFEPCRAAAEAFA